MPRTKKHANNQPRLFEMPESTTAKASKAQPQITTQRLSSIIKSARDIMRKDKGLNGDLDRLPVLTWIMFLKFLDDSELQREEEASLRGEVFRPAIEFPYRWRDWGANPAGISGPELQAFINQDEAIRPDGVRGLGLFAYLRSLQGIEGDDRRDVISTVFRGITNRMDSGYLLRDVINLVNGIRFASSAEVQTLGHLYETMLKEMRDAAGDSGEFYTPRPVVRLMVEILNPRLGELVFDPATGTGGFLVAAFEHLKPQAKSVEQRYILQKRSIIGGEAKSLPYLLCQMNLLLHGMEVPHISFGNSLETPIQEIGDRQRVDVILANPPFGGEEERGVLYNFPDDLRTTETTLLFLQLIMRKLRRVRKTSDQPGRAAVVVPNTTLFYGGVAARVRAKLVKEFNLQAVIRLPKGVFEPYTDIETNILIFDASGPTNEVLYYRLNPPDGRVQYTKTRPLRYEELEECLRLIKGNSTDSPNAWFVSAKDITARNDCNLDFHNPKAVRTTGEDPSIVTAKFSDSLRELMSRLQSLSPALVKLREIVVSRDSWVELQLGEVLQRRKDAIFIEDGRYYKRLRIQVKGRGVVLRDEVDGAQIGTKRQFQVEAGQFVLSKIDARNGAFGVVPEEGDGAIITGNFWAYDTDTSRLRPKLLLHLTSSDAFIQMCNVSSPGSTNRRYLQEEVFLSQTILVPADPKVQDELCEVLDFIASVSRLQELDLAKLSKNAPVLLQSSLHLAFGGEARSLEDTFDNEDSDEAEDE